jgi:hypothetical protein
VKLKEVDLSWSPDKIREFCEATDDWVLELPQHWQTTDIERLYRTHASATTPCIGVISEIAADSRTTVAALQDIWARFGTALEVASALATNPSASEPLLRELAVHPDEIVRQHAERTLEGLGQ